MLVGGMGTAAMAPAIAAASGRGPREAGASAAALFRVGTFNVENYFDTVDTPGFDDEVPSAADYSTKVSKLSKAIADKFGGADVIALEEVENQRVIDDLLARPELKGLGYRSVIMPTNDRRGINVAMIYRPTVEVTGVEQFNPKVEMPDGGRGQVDPSRLYARAPLVVDMRWTGAGQAIDGARDLTVIANHFKSKLGGSGPEPRRQAQGEMLGGLVDARRAAQPNRAVIVLGDLNATYEDGAFRKLASRADGSKRLFDTPLTLPDADRYTYRYRGRPDMLDHLLVTPDLQAVHVATSIPHFNSAPDAGKYRRDPKVPQGSSDHDPIISTFDLAKLPAAARAAVRR